MTKLQNHLKFDNIQLNDQLQYHSCMILIEIISSNLVTSLYISLKQFVRLWLFNQ